MELKLDRYTSNDQSTLGRLFIDEAFECYTLEDAHHDFKVHGKTRIPAGTYRVFLRALNTSHFDPNYLKRFGGEWFKGMLQLESVPGYEGVEIHIGNTAEDTDGCILVGKVADARNLTANGSMQILQSTDAFKSVYPKLRDALEEGKTVHITVIDEEGSLTS